MRKWENKGNRLGLSVPECDSTFGQIVGGQFQSHLVARRNAEAIPPQPAGQVSQDYAIVFQLHAEQPTGKLLQYRTVYFYSVLLPHNPPVWVGGPDGTMLPGSGPGPPILCSGRRDVGRLQTLRALRHFKFHLGAFIQGDRK